MHYIAETCPMDLIFVLDNSGSIGSTDFSTLKTFVSELVGTLDVSSSRTRVGLLIFIQQQQQQQQFY